MFHCIFPFPLVPSPYFTKVSDFLLIVRGSGFALFSPLSAKDRDAEGAGEVGEADGSRVRGAS